MGMDFVRRMKDFLLRWWGWQSSPESSSQSGEAILEFDSELNTSLLDLAELQHRSPHELLAEILNEEITRWAETQARNQEILRRWGSLTPREQQVAVLACRGQTNRQIGLALHISPETVKVHMRQVLSKLGYRTKRDLRLALAHWEFSE
jgi:DNA-binding NarL/FixJ family response regulator